MFENVDGRCPIIQERVFWAPIHRRSLSRCVMAADFLLGSTVNREHRSGDKNGGESLWNGKTC